MKGSGGGLLRWLLLWAALPQTLQLSNGATQRSSAGRLQRQPPWQPPWQQRGALQQQNRCPATVTAAAAGSSGSDADNGGGNGGGSQGSDQSTDSTEAIISSSSSSSPPPPPPLPFGHFVQALSSPGVGGGEACALLADMRRAGHEPTAFQYASAMKACNGDATRASEATASSGGGGWEKCLSLLQEMRTEAVAVNAACYAAALEVSQHSLPDSLTD